MGFHPRSHTDGGLNHGSLSVIRKNFATNYTKYLTSNDCQLLANICLKFSPLELLLAVIVGHDPLHHVFMKGVMPLTLDIILVGTSLWYGVNLYCLVALMIRPEAFGVYVSPIVAS